jgi:prolyl oligopeptidase
MPSIFALLFLLLPVFSAVSEDRTHTPRDPQTLEWVRNETARAWKFLAEGPSLLSALRARGDELAPRNPPPVTNLYGQNFVVKKGSLVQLSASEERVLVDAATLPTGAVVTEFRLSPDREKLAYGYAVFGNDWTTWNVIRVSDRKALAGPFVGKSSGISEVGWDPASQGFFYSAELTAAEDAIAKRVAEIRYHRLGTDMLRDPVVFKDPETPPLLRYKAKAFDRETVLVFRIQGAAEIPLITWLVKRTADGFGPPTPLIAPGRYWGWVTGFSNREVFLRTSKLGGTYGITAIDVRTGKERVVVSPSRRSVLLQAQQFGDRLVLQYLEADLTNSIAVTDLAGRVKVRWRPSKIGLPDRGTLSLLTGERESQTGDFTYHAVDLPTQTIRFDADAGTFALLSSEPVSFDGSRVRSTLRYYRSRDGVRIPIQVFARTDVPAPRFAYLFIYGNIGITSTSQFNRKFQLMLELGGVVAVANIRGGGEFGLPWQKVGTFEKWKSLEDIAAAARWLRKEFPSIEARVALSGRSFGGMNTMACYAYLQNEFAVYTPVVSVSDPEAFLDEVGWWAIDDFGFRRDKRGALVDEPRARKAIASWNPLRGTGTLTAAKPLLAFSGEFDLRVHPDQTTRFVRALRDRFGAAAPVYLIETEKIGHNGRAEIAEEAAFVAKEFEVAELMPLGRSISVSFRNGGCKWPEN